MRPPPPNRPPDNIWFRLLIPAGFLFCATALSWVMTSFDRSGAPIVRFIGRYAVWVILVEAAAIVAFALIAMAVDRRQAMNRRTVCPGTAPEDAGVADRTSSATSAESPSPPQSNLATELTRQRERGPG
jgi:hypothetical protein